MACTSAAGNTAVAPSSAAINVRIDFLVVCHPDGRRATCGHQGEIEHRSITLRRN